MKYIVRFSIVPLRPAVARLQAEHQITDYKAKAPPTAPWDGRTQVSALGQYHLRSYACLRAIC